MAERCVIEAEVGNVKFSGQGQLTAVGRPQHTASRGVSTKRNIVKSCHLQRITHIDFAQINHQSVMPFGISTRNRNPLVGVDERKISDVELPSLERDVSGLDVPHTVIDGQRCGEDVGRKLPSLTSTM